MTEHLLIMADHASWQQTREGFRRVVTDDDGGLHLIETSRRAVRTERLTGIGAELVAHRAAVPEGAARSAPELFEALSSLGVVGRFANPSLWDAIATAIVRQVIRAGQATRLYQQFSAAYGERVTFAGDVMTLFPAPEAVLGLSDEQFAGLGMSFKRHALRAAAEAFGKHGGHWRQLEPATLLSELQRVPRIGPWTAGATVADWSNDFSLYPYSDLAIRTWAARAAPSYPWPADEAGFADKWRALAGEHLSDLTLLTLAWGKHGGDHP